MVSLPVADPEYKQVSAISKMEATKTSTGRLKREESHEQQDAGGELS